MKKGLWQKRIPTVAAILLLFGSIWVTTFLIQKQILFIGRATPDKTPQNIVISNITSSSFSMSFTTSVPAISALSVAEGSKPPYIIFDDRDRVRGNQTPFYSHIITVSNLIPQTSHTVKILLDGMTYPSDGTTYTVKLGPLLGAAPKSALEVLGNAILPDGTAAGDTIVTAEVEGGQILSALTDDNGNYKIPLYSLRLNDLANYLSPKPDSRIVIKLLRQELSSIINSTVGTATNVPTITLSYQYNFIQTQEEEATASSILKVPSEEIKAGKIQIINPKQNAAFIDNRPLFQGTAIPNNSVKITIESPIIQTTVITNPNGTWSYRPPSPLSPGSHKITVQTLDQYGIAKSLTVDFSVYASGTQVSESATPSATPTTRPTTPTPTRSVPTPTLSGPTIVLPSPTAIITLTPTTFLTPIPTIQPTSVPTLPPAVTPVPTGNTTSIVLTLTSILLISAGFALLFLL